MKKKDLFLIILISISFLAQSQVPIYYSSFESISSFHTDTSNSIWEKGNPQKSVIDTAYNGQMVWTTSLDSGYNGIEESYLYSPQIIIAPFDSGFISFWQFVDLDTSLIGGKDICSNSFRKGSDTNWLSLGYQTYAGAINWFNANSSGTHGWHYDSSGWFQSSFPFFRNQSSNYFYQVDTVQFRFMFRSYANHTGDGWAIDNFDVSGCSMPIDMGIIDFILPFDSTITGSQVPVKLKLKNYGLDTIYSAQCTVLIDNTPTLSQTFSFPNGLLADSVIEVNFSNTYMSPNTDYEVTAIAKIANDNVVQNDTLKKTIISKLAQYDIALVGVKFTPSHHDTLYIGNNINVTIELKNCGYDTINTADFFYKVNNILKGSETWVGTIAPNDTFYYQFNTTFLSPIGYFLFSTIATVPGDSFNENNIYNKNMFGFIYPPIIVEEAKNNVNSHLIIFPNPTQNYITIDFSRFNHQKNLSLHLSNSVMKDLTIFTIEKNISSKKIDLSIYPPGIYFIRLQSGTKIIGIEKVIVQ